LTIWGFDQGAPRHIKAATLIQPAKYHPHGDLDKEKLGLAALGPQLLDVDFSDKVLNLMGIIMWASGPPK
jgi:hypothetical protein